MEPRLTARQIRERLESVGIDCLLCDQARKNELDSEALATDRILIGQGATADSREYWDEAVGSDSSALLLFTSGSTGKPKGMLLTHGNILNNASG